MSEKTAETQKMSLAAFMEGSPLVTRVIPTAGIKRPLANQPANPIIAKRNKFKEAIAQQLYFVECDKDGVIPEVKGKKYERIEGAGRGHSVEIIKRPIRWYFKSGSEYVLTIKYGSSSLFEDGFACRTLDEVKEILLEFNTSIVDSGKLDGLFESVKRPGRKANFA